MATDNISNKRALELIKKALEIEQEDAKKAGELG